MNNLIRLGIPSVVPCYPLVKPGRPKKHFRQYAARFDNAVNGRDLKPNVSHLPPVGVEIDDGRHKLDAVSFGGAGIFFWWELGCVMWLLEHIDIDSCTFYGASGGALASTLAACKVDPFKAFDVAIRLTEENKLFERRLGLAGVWGKLIEEWLDELLPPNAAEICQDRVTVVVTSLPKLGLMSFSEYDSKDHLIAANMASSHIPFFLDGKLSRSFNGVDCIDGSFHDFLSGSNSELLTRDGTTLLFDYFDDENLARKRFDFLALKEPGEIKNMMHVGYDYAERLSRTDKFSNLIAHALAVQPGIPFHNSSIPWTK